MRTRTKNANTTHTALLLAGAWGIVLASAGCGSDSADAGERARDSAAADGGSPGDTGGAGGDADGPIAVLTRVCGPDDCLHYLNVFDELPADKKIDRAQGIESGNTQGKVYNDAIYIFDRDDNSVTRWTVGENLALVEGETISFQSAGVTDACAICNVFGTPTHAYMVDSLGGVIVTWNPTTMEIVTVQDLPDDILSRDGLPASFAWPLVVNGRAYLAASWIDYETLDSFGKAAVATFDATVDRPTVTVLEDDRCGVSSSVTPFADDEGNVYVVGDWAAGLDQIGKATPAPNPACLLRIPAAQTSFDPDYYVDLLAAADARALYGAYAMGGGKLLLNHWPTSEPPPTLEAIAADPYAYYSGLGFRYSVLDLSAETSTLVEAIPPAGAGNNTPLMLDGVNHIQVYPQGQFTGEDPGADLFAIFPEGRAEKVLEAGNTGDFEMIGRVR